MGRVTQIGRPRVHEQEAILDAAEELLVADPDSLTIRSLAQRTGAPSGSLYHAFGSRAALLGAMWLRAARTFLALQRESVDLALSSPGDPHENAIAATVAAALTLAHLRRERPNTAALLITQRRERLLDQPLPDRLAADLKALDKELLEVLRTLARAVWARTDRAAVETIAACVVDVPTALLFRRRPTHLDHERLIEAAVTGIIEHAPPRDRHR